VETLGKRRLGPLDNPHALRGVAGKFA